MLLWLITALKMENNGYGEIGTLMSRWWEYKIASGIKSCAGALQNKHRVTTGSLSPLPGIRPKEFLRGSGRGLCAPKLTPLMIRRK